MHDFGAWLDSLGIGQCRALLAAHDIDQDVLRDLTDQDLERAGLSIGHRRKLLRAVRELPPNGAWPGAPARAERRQITVMFCDLVGSTALAGKLDPEDLRQVIVRHLHSIAAAVGRFGGYVAQYLGDGALVYFGWPQAHEDAAEQAARAGLAAVEAVRAAQANLTQLDVRVGIATGLVVVGDAIGAGASSAQVAVGETPNLAARLQSVAEPNTVVIATSTRKLLGTLFDLEAVGPFELKGVAAPVAAWRVLRERNGGSRFRALRRAASGSLVNRVGELALLDELWSRATRGAGQAVLLSGEAGIGKTRIVEAFGNRLRDGPYLRLRYQCLPNHANTALHPVIGAVSRAAGFVHNDPEAVRLAKLRRLLRGAGLASEQLLAAFAGILSLATGPGGPPTEERPWAPQDGDLQQRKAGMLALLVDQLGAMARRQPVLLQFEDMHWSDPTSLELCERIVARAAGLPLLVIATSRPEFTAGWPPAPHVHHRAVSRLGRDHSAELIQQVVGQKIFPRSVADQILAKTDGVPLFVEELTMALLESDVLTEDRQGWSLTGPMSPLSVPTTLQDSLTARLDRLGWAKQVAQTAAVIGRDFSPQLLGPVTGLPPDRLERALRRLCDAQLVVQQGELESASYTFRHVLIQDAAYAGLLLSERRALHAAIAQSLEADFPDTARSQPELIAHHYSEARQPAQAVTWWRNAGRRSIQASAYVEAIDQLSRGLAQLEKLPQTAERDRLEAAIRTDLGTPLIGVGGYTSEAVRANIARGSVLHERTAGVSPFPSLAGQLGIAFAGADALRAVSLGEQFLAAAEAAGDRQLRVIGHWLVGMALTGAARLPAARVHLERSLALNDQERDAGLAVVYGTDPRVASLGYHALVLQQLGLSDGALASDAASLAHAARTGHSATLGYALTLRVCLHMLRADDAALAAAAAELGRLAVRQSSELLATASEVILGLLELAGKPDQAVFTRLRGAIHSIHRAGWNVIFGWLSLLGARICVRHGWIDAARQTLDGLQAIIEPRGHGLFVPEMLRLRAALAARAGEADDTIEAHLRRALAAAQTQGARLAELRCATDLACFWRDRGRRETAFALLAPVCGWFAEAASTRDLEAARSALTTLR